MKTVTLPNTITAIKDNAFGYCKSLNEIYIPSSVAYIGNNCFSGCISLKEIQIPPLLTVIEENCFSGCKSLRKVNFPNVQNSNEECSETRGHFHKLALIKKNAFQGSGLEQINIPPSVSFIDQYAFGECYLLREIIIPSSITEIK